MKKIVVFCCALLVATTLLAQGPKWVVKAKKAVFSIITFDKDNNILQRGNGFFIDESGVGVSNYKIFDQAYRATVIDSDGKEFPVYTIQGADDMYNVVKFQVDTKGKKSAALPIAAQKASVGNEVVVVPYSVNRDRSCRPGVVRSIEDFSGDFKYYTLDLRLTSDLVSCPVMTLAGEVVGIAESSYGSSTSDVMCHAVDIDYIDSLEVGALSFDTPSLSNIHIKKGLPANEEQALAHLLMVRNKLSDTAYLELLNDFEVKFPNSVEGSLNIARFYLGNTNLTEDDLDKAALEIESIFKKKEVNLAEAYYGVAKLIMSANYVELAKTRKEWSLDRALELLDKAKEVEPIPFYDQMRAEIFVMQQRWDDALTCYNRVNSSNLRSPQTLLTTAQVQEKAQKGLDVVLQTLDSCVNMLSEPYDVSSAVYLFERGRIHAESGSFRAAMLDLNNYYYAVNGQVNDQFLYFREQVALEAKMYQQALDDIQAAIKQNPNEVLYHLEYGALNLKIGRYKEALAILDDLLEKDKGIAEAYRLQGVAYTQLKDKDRACRKFKKAQELGDKLSIDLAKKVCPN